MNPNRKVRFFHITIKGHSYIDFSFFNKDDIQYLFHCFEKGSLQE